MKRSYTYSSYDQDLVENSGQNFSLPEDYRYIRDRFWERHFGRLLYYIFGLAGQLYWRICLRARFIGVEKLSSLPRDKGYFIYANHTQPFGDPMLAMAIGCSLKVRRRNRAIGSPANFGLPVLGPLFPAMGGIPTASDREGLQKMEEAISYYARKAQPVVIFPEAHVWPYYTGIRPFGTVSFHYPVKENLPCFSMTVCYKKAKVGKKPLAKIYIDGPFYPEENLPIKKRKTYLCERVRDAMLRRASESDYEYVKYTKDDGQKEK
ncbi:MAG: lysophospholipid acyltransferase family protein [Candidatus Cryptobacteroides sp.]